MRTAADEIMDLNIGEKQTHEIAGAFRKFISQRLGKRLDKVKLLRLYWALELVREDILEDLRTREEAEKPPKIKKGQILEVYGYLHKDMVFKMKVFDPEPCRAEGAEDSVTEKGWILLVSYQQKKYWIDWNHKLKRWEVQDGFYSN